ncbi:hypothetical protein Tco_0179742 [Tanacetum coccineum]
MERESLSPDSEFNYILERYFHRSRSRSGSISYPVLDRTNWIAIRGYCSELCDYDLDIWILILEEATNTRDSSTGSDSRNKYVHFPVGVFPYLKASCFIMHLQRRWMINENVKKGGGVINGCTLKNESLEVDFGRAKEQRQGGLTLGCFYLGRPFKDE